MKKTYFIALAVFLVFIFGCKPSRNKSVQNIQDYEKSLYSGQMASFTKVKADSLVTMYENFVKRFPKDSLAPQFLFKAAQVSMNMENGNKALAFFNQFITQYPEHPKASVCLFFKGYVYENLLHDLDKAKEIYTEFAEKYPDNEFADDALMAIKNLGKTPDEMIREFEARQKADSIAKADSLAKLREKKSRKSRI